MHKNSKGLDGTLDCVGELHGDGAMGGGVFEVEGYEG
jgi:hypothetical protein